MDVYEWAGRIRTIDMSKGGGSVFQPLQLFDTGVRYAETTLRDDHMLQGLDRGRFIERLAVSFDNFNTLHPFREGNGRTQRVFWTLIARDAGWGLDWSQVSKRENDVASFIAHENVDYTLSYQVSQIEKRRKCQIQPVKITVAKNLLR
jgi:cell filamentation protein